MAVAVSVLGAGAGRQGKANLMRFRRGWYDCLSRRADALFELTDALLAAGPVISLPYLSLDGLHRRGHGKRIIIASSPSGAGQPPKKAQGAPERGSLISGNIRGGALRTVAANAIHPVFDLQPAGAAGSVRAAQALGDQALQACVVSAETVSLAGRVALHQLWAFDSCRVAVNHRVPFPLRAA